MKTLLNSLENYKIQLKNFNFLILIFKYNNKCIQIKTI